jgi:hypothetical protein
MSDHYIVRMPQRTYSRDLASSDIHLIGSMNDRPGRKQALQADTHFEQEYEILYSIPVKEIYAGTGLRSSNRSGSPRKGGDGGYITRPFVCQIQFQELVSVRF